MVTLRKAEQVQTQTDWQCLRSMTDDEIARATASDPDAAPIPTAEELKQYKPASARLKREPTAGAFSNWV